MRVTPTLNGTDRATLAAQRLAAATALRDAGAALAAGHPPPRDYQSAPTGSWAADAAEWEGIRRAAAAFADRLAAEAAAILAAAGGW